MVLSLLFGALAFVSFALTLWQWVEARRFPLHSRVARREPGHLPALTLFKPLKGCDDQTEACLRSWLTQEYGAPVQFLFGVSEPGDPAAALVERLSAEFATADVRLVVSPERRGLNSKVSKLIQLERDARHDVWVVSDADVWVPPGFLGELAAPLAEPGVGLVNPFYRFVGASNLAMRWEAFGVNADFWSGVLQSRRLQPIRFALGAVMAVRRSHVDGMGGFTALRDMLADDYELGRRVAARGGRVALCAVVVECREARRSWAEAWAHQVRWARTIRVCMPGPYAASVLSNATFWPLAGAAVMGGAWAWTGAGLALGARWATAANNHRRLTGTRLGGRWFWMPWFKDVLQMIVWALAFVGTRVEWRGEVYRVRPDGRLERGA